MAGVYIHIPFCKSRCKYCDFFSTTDIEKQARYVDALLAEWQQRQSEITDNIETIYIGGGTPSILDCTTLSKITNAFAKSSPLEFTLEANPGDFTREKAQSWRDMGINRLSIGIQSFDDQLLTLIGRRHTGEQARQAVAIAQSVGFDNISIDLIYALPGQTMQMWQNDVDVALQLGIQHISAYGLIYEEDTALTTLLEHGVIASVDEDTEMRMYDYLVERLKANGFVHYEVSNFALPGYQSKHNSNYWHDIPYMGLGASAHSYNGEKRSWNISDLDLYIEHMLQRQLQPEVELLTDEQRHIEHIMLGLRTNSGIDIDTIEMSKAEPYLAQGLLIQEGKRIMATPQGFHILNRIIEDLI